MWGNFVETSLAAANVARAMRLPTAPIARAMKTKDLPQVAHPGGPPRSYENFHGIGRDAEGESPATTNDRWDQLYADEFSRQ